MKRLALIVAVILGISVFIPLASASLQLPGNLTIIEEESFYGVSAITGIINIPSNILEIGDNAFSGTRAYALNIPSSTIVLGDQDIATAAYVHLHSTETIIGVLDGISCIIGPDNSAAQNAANGQGIVYINESELIENDGFFYQRTANGLTLLCAIDNSLVSTSITIPYSVNNEPVTAISGFAFKGCNSLTSINLPDTVMGKLTPSALADCSEAGVNYLTEEGYIVIEVIPGTLSTMVGKSITWAVTHLEESNLIYHYQLKNGDTVIDDRHSEDSSYSILLEDAGDYILFVEVFSDNSIIASGTSDTVTVHASGEEVLQISLPSVIEAGEDLSIEIFEISDALRYGVFLTNETTGELVSTWTTKNAGEHTFEGFLLSPGTYRVTGYVYGNDFSSILPTVRQVNVIGEMAEGISLNLPESLQSYQQYSYPIPDECAIWEIDRDNTGAELENYKIRNTNGNLEFSLFNDRYLQGGSISVAISVKQNGRWSDWGAFSTIQILPIAQLGTPEITLPDEILAGHDTSIQFGSVENATNYYVRITQKPDNKQIYSRSFSRAGQLFIPGYNLEAGEYVIDISVSANSYRESRVKQSFFVTGEQPLAPTLTSDSNLLIVDRNTYNGSVTIGILAEDGMDAMIRTRLLSNEASWYYEEIYYSVSLNEYGTGTHTQYYEWGPDTITGYYCEIQACVILDNTWSSWSSPLRINLAEPEKLNNTIITSAQALQAGEDFSFRFSAVDHADYYNAKIYSEYMYYETIWRQDHCIADTDIIVPGYYLTQGPYRIEISACADGYTKSTTETTFQVNGTRPLAPTVTASSEEMHINQSIAFVVGCENADAAILRRTGRRYDGAAYSDFYSVLFISNNIASYQWTPNDSYLDSTLSFDFAVKANGVWSAWRSLGYTVLGLPQLDAPEINLSAEIPAGEDVVISFSAIENAERYRVQINYQNTGIYYSTFTRASQVVIPGYKMEPGEYELTITVSGNGYQSRSVSRMFTVTGERPVTNVILTANKPQLYADYNDSVCLNVSAPGSDGAVLRIRLTTDTYNDNIFETISLDGDGNGIYNLGNYFWSLEDVNDGWYMEIQASPVNNGIWFAWSEPVILPIIKRESLAEPTVIMQDIMQAGEDLSLRFSAVAHAEYYEVSLYSAYSSNQIYRWDQSKCIADADITLPGYYLSQGYYRIVAKAFADGYISSSTEAFFRVNGTRPTAPNVTANSEEIHISQSIAFNIVTTNADNAVVRRTIQQTNGSSSTNYIEIPANNDSANWQWAPYEWDLGATATFEFAVKTEGLWSAWRSLNYTVLGLPQLDTPEITLPAVIPAGQDLTISFGAVDNAENYNVSIIHEGETIYLSSFVRASQIILPGYMIESGEYTFRITASGSNYQSCSVTRTFNVSGEKPVTNIVLSAEKNLIYADYNDSVRIYISSAGNEGAVIRARQSLYNDYNYYTVGLDGNGNGSFVQRYNWSTQNVNDGCYLEIQASSVAEGIWSAWTTPIIIPVIKRETLAEPIITISDTLQAGKDLSYSFSAVPYAEYYEAWIYNAYGNNTIYSWNRSTCIAETNITLPGYYLAQGAYRIVVTAYASEYLSNTSEATFRVNGARPTAPSVAASTEELRITQPISFSISSENSFESAIVRYTRQANNSTYSPSYSTLAGNTNTVSWQWAPSESYLGNTIVFEFAVKKDEVWSSWCSLNYTVLGLPQLDTPMIHMESSFETGQDVDISFDAVPNADSYTLYVYNPDGSLEIQKTAYAAMQNRIGGQNTVAGTYRIKVTASGAGYSSSSAETTFTMTGERSIAPEVICNTAEVYTNETFIFTLLNTSDAEEIAYRYKNTTDGYRAGTINILSNVTVWETNNSSPGIWNYSFCVLRDGYWSAWSEPITITVNARPALPATTLTVPESILQGQNLSISVEAIEGATQYYLDVYDAHDRRIATRSFSTPGTIVFQGCQLPLGTIRIELYAYSNNYSESYLSAITSVIASELPNAPVVTPPENLTIPRGTSFTFSIYNNDAERYSVRYYRVGNTNNIYYSFFNPSEGSATEWSTTINNGDYTYGYSFSAYVNGTWSEWSTFVEITTE